MTDNEKRAHDLAVAVSVDICQTNREIGLSNGKETVSFDYIKQYIDVYETALESFSEKFPTDE